jgi:hypothetical protein
MELGEIFLIWLIVLGTAFLSLTRLHAQQNLPCCSSAVILSQIASIPSSPIRPQHTSVEEERRIAVSCAHIDEIQPQQPTVCLPQEKSPANHCCEQEDVLIKSNPSSTFSQYSVSSETSLIKANPISTSTRNEKLPCTSSITLETSVSPVEARNSTDSRKETDDPAKNSSVMTTSSKAHGIFYN